MSLANKTELFGVITTSSWLKAGAVNLFNFEEYKLCFCPSLVNSMSCAIPIWGPFGEILHFPPAAVTVTCRPQHDAKIFCSLSKHFLANSICFLISLLLSLTRSVLPVKIIPLYFFKDFMIFKTDLSSPGATISISLLGSIFFTCNLKFSDCDIQPAALKLIFSSLVLPSTINIFKNFFIY